MKKGKLAFIFLIIALILILSFPLSWIFIMNYDFHPSLGGMNLTIIIGLFSLLLGLVASSLAIYFGVKAVKKNDGKSLGFISSIIGILLILGAIVIVIIWGLLLP